MNSKSTIGIIGCGLIADTHVESILETMPGAQIAVCDCLLGKAELLRRKYGLKGAYTQIEEMLFIERPLAVHVLSPPQLHVAHSSQCLAAGCHVLLEKPLCFAADEARKLYDSADRLGLTLCVDHSLLYQPSVARMLAILRSNPGFRVVNVHSYYGLDGEGGKGRIGIQHWKEMIPGGLMMDAVVHPASLAVTLTGKPKRVHANQVLRNGEISELHTSWETENGTVGITVSASGQPFRRMTEVVTTGMSFIVDHSSEVLVTLPQIAGPKAIGKLARNLSHGFQLELGTANTVWKVVRGQMKQNPGARGLIKAFYEHLNGKLENPVSKANAIDTVTALTGIVQAVESAPKSVAKNNLVSESLRIEVKPAIRTLVTGASGFLGRAICEQLAAEGRRTVVAITRRGPNAEKLPAASTIEKRFADFRYFSPEDYRHLVEGVSEVVHCAHASGARTWEEYKQQNIDASLSLYEAAVAAGCRKFIHISSVAVYGVHNRRSNIISEALPLTKGRSIWDYYIRSKAEADKQLTEAAKTNNLPLLLLRPGILYSVDGNRIMSKSLPVKNGRLFIDLGSGRNRLPYTRVDVLAQAIIRALNAGEFPQGSYIVSGRTEKGSRQFRQERLEALGIKCRFISVPIWPFRPLAAMLELVFWLSRSHKPPKLTRYILDSACRDLIYDCRKAEKELGWSPDKAIEFAVVAR